jgi:alpha-beta hydrolase superfamily lysophospholipase
MTFDWLAPDGERFSCEEWPTRERTRGVVVCVHGLGGAATDFVALAAAAGLRGFACLTTNLRGQGLDPVAARRGAFLDLPVLARDLAAFVTMARARFPGVPLFLCGESMGALIVSWLLTHHVIEGPVDGAIFSAPVIDLIKPTPWAVRQVVRLLAAATPNLRFYPAWFVSGKTAPLRVTRDEEHAQSVRVSPHNIRAFTFRTLNHLGNLMESRASLAAGVKVPTLVLAAGMDAYLKPEQVRAWFDLLAAKDKTYRLYPEAYHLLWNDWDRDEVLGDMLAWLDARADRVSI